MDPFTFIDNQIPCDDDQLLLSGPLAFSAVNAALHFRSSTCSTNESLQFNQSQNNQDQPIHFEHSECSKVVSKPLIFVPSRVGFHKSVIVDHQPLSFNQQPIFSFTSSLPQSKSNKDLLAQRSVTKAEAFCHPLNSCIVHMACKAVLQQLSCILSTYHGDIEHTVHSNQYRIDGVVFISDHSVHFVLYIHGGDEESVIEYRRCSGDSMASANFWNWIQQQIENVDASQSVPGQFQNFEPTLGSDESPISYELYLDDITRSIQQNECLMVDELRVLYQSVNSDNLCAEILAHKSFCNVIIGALQHANLSVSRLAILILQRIASTPKGRTFCAGNRALFGNINKLFCCHERAFMKRHALCFLGYLTESGRWNMDKIDESQLVWRIGEYAKKSGDDEIVERIQKKLAAMGH